MTLIDRAPPQVWHVHVNNPTDAPVTTTLAPTMPDLGGFGFTQRTLTLAAGEHRNLQ